MVSARAAARRARAARGVASLILQPETNSSLMEQANNRSRLFSAYFAHPWRDKQ